MLLATSLLALAAPLAVAPAYAQGGHSMSQQVQPGQFLVFFDFDRAEIRPDAREVISQAAQYYRETGAVDVQVAGYTDLAGSSTYNQGLSERRADAVRQELIRQGVPSTVIRTVADGENDPLVQTADGVPEARNRRVSIIMPEPPAPVAEAPAPAPMAEPEAPKRFWASLGGMYGYNLKETDGEDEHTSHLGGGELTLGYRATPNLTLKAGQGAFYAFNSEDDGWGGRSTLGFDVPFNLFGWEPYFGVNGGYIYGHGVQDGWILGPEIGTRVDLSDQAFAYARIAYDFNFRNDWDEGIPNAGIGVGMRF